MAEDSMLADVFDELFSQDYESLKDVNKIYEDYKEKEKHLSNSVKSLRLLIQFLINLS